MERWIITILLVLGCEYEPNVLNRMYNSFGVIYLNKHLSEVY